MIGKNAYLRDRERELEAGRPPTIEAIVAAAARVFGVEVKAVTGAGRSAKIVRARHAAMYVARKATCLTLEEIGAGVGGHHHSTVSHGVARMEALEDEVQRDELVLVEAVARSAGRPNAPLGDQRGREGRIVRRICETCKATHRAGPMNSPDPWRWCSYECAPEIAHRSARAICGVHSMRLLRRTDVDEEAWMLYDDGAEQWINVPLSAGEARAVAVGWGWPLDVALPQVEGDELRPARYAGEAR